MTLIGALRSLLLDLLGTIAPQPPARHGPVGDHLTFERGRAGKVSTVLTVFIYHTCTTLHKKNEYKNEKRWREQDLQP